jgi:hypothetical protein
MLSTPLTACLVTFGRYLPALEFLEVLFGDRPVLRPHVAYFQRLLAKDEDEATELLEEYMASHPLQDVYENVLLPALQLAKVNQDREELSDHDVQAIYAAAQQTLDGVAPPLQPAGVTADGSVRQALARGHFNGEEDAPELPLVLGCPVRDEADELALRMFGHLVDRRRVRFEVLPQGTLSGELCARVREDRPAAVCLFVLPPGGITQARMLCKRLRSESPELKILVACWRGEDDDPGRLRAHLERAGADEVATGLVELRDRLAAQLPALDAQAEREAAPAG